MIRWILIAILLLAAHAGAAPVMVVDSQSEYWLPLDAEGWVNIEPSVDSRVIYVSNDGDDENDGLSEKTPVATEVRAKALLRTGYPDWVRFRRGDTWVLADGNWHPYSGRSITEPSVVTWYGDTADPRPVLRGNLRLWGRNYIVVSGLHMDRTATENLGAYAYNSTDYCWLEDCFFDEMQVTCQLSCSYFVFRRNVVYNTYALSTEHQQGIYIEGTSPVLLEQNVFDHCGWDDTEASGAPTTRNHGLYIKENCTGVVVRNNIIARSSATGAQMRSGGDCTGNLFIDNPIGLDWGYVNGSPITIGGVTGEVSGNVFVGDANICRPRPSCEIEPRGKVMQIGNVASGTIANNVMINVITGDMNNAAFSLDSDFDNNGIDTENYALAGNIGISNLTISKNVIWQRGRGIYTEGGIFDTVVFSGNVFQDVSTSNRLFYAKHAASISGGEIVWSGNTYYQSNVASPWYAEDTLTSYDWSAWVTLTGDDGTYASTTFTDSARTIETYMASLGYGAGDQTVEKFLELARANNKLSWDSDFLSAAPIAYIQAGFTE